jgi:two-component system chemotaxis response regulator CheB
VHEAGGVVLAQDAATSAVWGMPGRVFEAGLSREPLPLTALADELTLRVNAGRGGRASRDPSAMTTLSLRQNGNAASAPQPEVVHGLL